MPHTKGFLDVDFTIEQEKDKKIGPRAARELTRQKCRFYNDEDISEEKEVIDLGSTWGDDDDETRPVQYVSQMQDYPEPIPIKQYQKNWKFYTPDGKPGLLPWLPQDISLDGEIPHLPSRRTY